MNSFFLLPFVWLLDAAQAAKGPRTLKRIPVPQHPGDGYHVVTSGGFNIAIFCSEIVYLITYAAWWARSRRISIYLVYCTCSANTPQVLKDKFSKEFKIPNMSHSLSSTTARKKAAIDAYVDTIIADE